MVGEGGPHQLPGINHLEKKPRSGMEKKGQ